MNCDKFLSLYLSVNDKIYVHANFRGCLQVCLYIRFELSTRITQVVWTCKVVSSQVAINILFTAIRFILIQSNMWCNKP